MMAAQTSCGSGVVMLDDPVIQAENPSQPVITNLNITESSRVHIGPKFVAVTQNVDGTKVVKDLPFHRYIWHLAKTTTTTEKVVCAVAILALFACIMVIVYFTVIAKSSDSENNETDVAPDEWYITRDMWLATKFNHSEIAEEFNPLRLVIVAHTVSSPCYNFIDCAAELRSLQSYFINSLEYDIPFNFLIGNDGRVYEGRGFNIEGAHTFGYNRCSLGLAFIGDYREGEPSFSEVTPLQQERAHMLFEKGVQLGYLHSHFHVLGAKDLQTTLSPGTNLYNAIQQWPNYDHENLYRDLTCEEIQELFKNETIASTATISTTNK